MDPACYFVDTDEDPGSSPDSAIRKRMIHALEQNNLDDIKQLIEREGFDPNTKIVSNETALHTAATYCPVEIVQYLLDHGARPVMDSRGESPLDWVLIYRDVERPDICRVLLPHCGRAFNADETATMFHAARRNLDWLLRGLITDFGWDPNARGRGISHPVNGAIRARAQASLLTLIELGADVHKIQDTDESPLLAAYCADNDKAAALLMRLGIDLDLGKGLERWGSLIEPLNQFLPELTELVEAVLLPALAAMVVDYLRPSIYVPDDTKEPNSDPWADDQPTITVQGAEFKPSNPPFRDPMWIAVSFGAIYVSDRDGRVFLFGLDGSFARCVEPEHSGDYQSACGLVLLAGALCAADASTNRICWYHSDGDFSRHLSLPFEPCGITCDGGLFFFTCPVDHRVHVYEPYAAGTLVNSFGSKDEEGGCLDSPFGIAYYDRHLFVTNLWGHSVSMFRTDGHFVRRWGSKGSGPGQLYHPKGIAARRGQLYVADSGNHSVCVFKFDGTFVRRIGSKGSGDNEFNDPRGICAVDNGLLVVDGCNRRVRFIHDE